ncbi:Mu transposase C-terminal domain-containing protein [Bacillus andreraoultii]|uniref:Mu transposase C-terminal domain-containing protein n=1 Tax=Bacillus andreraoultii TaxID=1499685 RepID=UPI000539D127|nr:Mu transposase C-terminal domain-containing protein [Bacillus andreraoultii]
MTEIKRLAVNELLKNNKEPEKIERIIWIDSDYHWIYLMDLKRPTFPYPIEIQEIEFKLQIGELVKVTEDPLTVIVDEDELSKSEKEKRDKAWEVIQSIYITPDIFLPKQRGRLVNKASEKFNISKKTIRNYLKRFWVRGMVKNALLPDYYNCGRNLNRERTFSKKAGRPFNYSSSIKRAPINDEWKRIFKASLEKYYFIRTKPSLKYAYQQMLKEYFSVKEKGKSKLKVLDIEKPIPSFNQFYYWYRKWYEPDYAIHKREGRREFLQNYRAITGSSREDSGGIGTYAIDATIADIYLVSSLDRNSVIGRPVVYLSVDQYSQAIVGVGIGIQNMSGESLRVALANTFGDKVEYCKKTLDMEISSEDWPIQYLPHTILADRGSELISNDLSSIAENLNIRIQNTGSFRPELKAVVEKYFDIVQEHIKPFLPGAVHKDFMKRGGHDYRKKSVLNVKEYSQILVRCILYYNNHHYLQNYPLTKEMIEDKIRPIPIEIFKWGLKRGMGLLRTVSMEFIRSNVYPSTEGLVTPRGILFEGLLYSSTLAMKEGWFSKARIQGNWKVRIHYDPQSMEKIYIRINRNKYDVCTLVEHQYGMFKNANIDEVHDLRKNRKQQKTDFEAEELNSQVKLAQEIEEIVKRAKEESKIESINGSVKKNVKDIRKNRSQERNLKEMKRRTTDGIPKVKRLQEDESYSFDENLQLEMFLKKQKEVLESGND